MTDAADPDDVFDFDVSPPDDARKWLVLYPEDYDDVMLDGEDQVALLVDIEQAGEIVRLGTTAIASLSARADGADDVMETLIEELERQLEDDDA